MSQPAALRHLPSLDGLRGLAVLMVVPHNLRLMSESDGWASQLLTRVMDRGWIGVELFFVLSGFLITRILLETRPADNYYGGFYARRGLRIWPLYYATLLIWLVGLPLLGWLPPHDRSHDVYLWTFLINLVPLTPHGGAGLPHFWSLAVEEQFYLLWPLLVRHVRPRWLVHGGLWLVLGSGLARWATIQAGWSDEAVYTWTPCRLDALALGEAVAALLSFPSVSDWLQRHARWTWAWPVGLALGGAALSGGYKQFGLIPQTLGYAALGLACAAWLLCLVAADLGWMRLHCQVLRSAWLRRVGRYSYGMYVIHVPMGTLLLTPLARRLGWTVHPSVAVQMAYMALGVALSYGLAVLSYHGLERHFLALKDRFAPRFTESG